jgi:hypothetical protein
MGMKITGVNATRLKLARTEKVTHKRLLRHLRNSAEEVAKLARAFAPVDEGNLEEAIEASESKEGFFSRKRSVVFVGVNPDKLGEGYTESGFRYDVRMHEGAYKLSPASLEKQRTGGKTVGPKYLTRAWQELEPEITAKAEAISDDIVNRS